MLARCSWLSCCLLPCLALSAICSAADPWPQFRGPDGQGQAGQCGLPLTWSEEQNIAWKTALPGSGHSSPVLGRGLAWMTTADEEGRSLGVVAVDLASGRIVQQREVLRAEKPPTINAKNSWASPTPVLDGDRLFVHFGTSGTACIATDSAQTVWTNQSLVLDHGEGPGSSPILWKNLLIVNCDGTDVQYVVALDKLTGQIVWKTPRSGPFPPQIDQRKAFCTPLVITVDGRELLISPGAQRVIAYNPADGKELWNVEYPPGWSNVPRPLYGHGLLYICTGFMKPEIWAIRPDGQGDVTASHVAWKYARNAPANPSPLLVDDLVYMVSDSGIATCLDALTGQEVWRERLGDNYWASPLAADGRIYFWSEGGETVVIEPGRQLKVLARNHLDGSFMASPAVVDSSLIVRTRTHLYRIQAASADTAKLSQTGQ